MVTRVLARVTVISKHEIVMRIGVNWIAPQSLPIIRELIEQGHAEFCEIMVDNFIHLPPEKIQAALPDVPIALHIIASRFMEKTHAELKQLANHLRPWIHALKPMYVSDHLLQFNSPEGKRLPFIAEWNYDKEGEQIKTRVREWQELLEMPLLLENHASITPWGEKQADFFSSLLATTNTHLLFDFSNAYIADYNRICSINAWQPLLKYTKHFHVAGFKVDPASQLAIDTHDEPLANEVIHLLKQHKWQKDQTLVVEFDANIQLSTWQQEILQLKTKVMRCHDPA